MSEIDELLREFGEILTKEIIKELLRKAFQHLSKKKCD